MPVAVLVYMYLILCYMYIVAGQINLGQTGRDTESNTITLVCQDINDELITDAIFYRNGAILTDDPCFSGSMVSGGLVTITVSPPCEGYFSCGEDGGTIVSTPKPIYGMCLCATVHMREGMFTINMCTVLLSIRMQNGWPCIFMSYLQK